MPLVIDVGTKRIGGGWPCFIVAEAGQNHNGDIHLAHRLVDQAAECGADAVKFQKQDPDACWTRQALAEPYNSENSFGATYGEHRRFLEFPIEVDAKLKAYAESKGLIWFCTACDIASAKALAEIGNPVFKIASRDLVNWPLLDFIARLGKPIILSTGMDDLETVRRAVGIVRRHTNQLVLMHCTSAYPCESRDVHLRAMEVLRAFGCPVGLSDHSIGISVPVVAATLGAACVEKHITLSRALRGTDHAGSLEADGLRRVVRDIRNLDVVMGSPAKLVPHAVEKMASILTSGLIARIPRRAVAIVPARMNASRLPGKVLMGLGGRPILRWVVNALEDALLVDAVVVAVAAGEENRPILDACQEWGVKMAVGHPDDVVARIHKIAVEQGATIIIRATADNPMIRPDLVDRTIEHLLRTGAEYVGWEGMHEHKAGIFVEALTAEALARQTGQDHHLEHLTQGMETEYLSVPPDVDTSIKLSIDMAEDLDRVRAHVGC